MAQNEPEKAPEAAPPVAGAQPGEPAPDAPETPSAPEAVTGATVAPGASEATGATGARRWPGVWAWLLIVAAGLLGLGLGVGVVLRGSSLGSTPAGSTASRPTFVIGTAISPVPGRSPSPVVGRDYVVEPGDTLRSIAQSVYGDADQWQRIYSANREAIGSDPDALLAGMHLRIP